MISLFLFSFPFRTVCNEFQPLYPTKKVQNSSRRIFFNFRIRKSVLEKKSKPKSILFVLDEFDRFASSVHQNFLYNVLDKTTSNPNLNENQQNLSVFVIGISCRLVKNLFRSNYDEIFDCIERKYAVFCFQDFVELLEKRVRSRLSQKQLLLFNNWTFDEYISFVKQFLKLPVDSQASKKFVKTWNDGVQVRKFLEFK